MEDYPENWVFFSFPLAMYKRNAVSFGDTAEMNDLMEV